MIPTAHWPGRRSGIALSLSQGREQQSESRLLVETISLPLVNGQHSEQSGQSAQQSGAGQSSQQSGQAPQQSGQLGQSEHGQLASPEDMLVSQVVIGAPSA
jgi:hypothetical protein